MKSSKYVDSRLAVAPIGSDREIWLAAGLMIQEYGAHAVIKASQCADEALALGDLDNQRLWKRVIRSIAAITEPGDAAH
ncbi:MAG TPA: hypothetical protein VF194_04900 [Ferrovibrio sp.]|uniref:hypothetical protein n=1 Tax=Ferrovibrio sp. TaxID=1917215 RepID=UPI002ED0BB60